MENDPLRDEDETFAFKSLGLHDTLLEACIRLKWHRPSRIQREAIPLALQGRDIIGLAETGSGKTGAFALPILQSLMTQMTPLHALVLTPTRELAMQISLQFEELGRDVGVKTGVVIGGVDMVDQAIQLAKNPHIIIATPGRILEHLENNNGFKLNNLKFLVLDEADKILNMDFEEEVNKILAIIPKPPQTFLLSATMTHKVAKLQRACLRDPVKVEVSFKYQTPRSLGQHYLLVPNKHKEIYLYHLITLLKDSCVIIFCNTCIKTLLISRLLKHLGKLSIFLHGQLSQEKRLHSLERFRRKEKRILVATDVASRGLDIPHVDAVINYDIPEHNKDYFHRVGRTARAGKPGRAFTIVTQYDIKELLSIEKLLGFEIGVVEVDRDEVMRGDEKVYEAKRVAKRELVELEKRKMKTTSKKEFKRKGEDDDDDDGDDDDADEATGVRRKFKRSKTA